MLIALAPFTIHILWAVLHKTITVHTIAIIYTIQYNILNYAYTLEITTLDNIQVVGKRNELTIKFWTAKNKVQL